MAKGVQRLCKGRPEGTSKKASAAGRRPLVVPGFTRFFAALFLLEIGVFTARHLF
jgi:hypothetical protein